MLFRNVPFEPGLDPNLHTEAYALKKAHQAIQAGRPVIVCMHSINFHSTLKNHRENTLSRLDRFLTALEENYPDLLYLNDHDILQIVRRDEGEWSGKHQKIKVTSRRQPSPAMMHHLRKVPLMAASRAAIVGQNG
jgi:hypothetical protein